MDEIFIYDCNLNIESFIHMLDDPTECYKFYWLDSIMQLLSEQEETITFDKVISGMVADAWYSVTEYHLRMGTKDSQGNSVNSIERAVNKLDALKCLEHTADRWQVLEKIEENEKLLHDEKYQISKNVPYRLLSSFMRELGGNDPLWDQRTRLIAYMEMISNKCCLPYTIGNERGLEKKIIIEDRWKRFLIDNMVAIRGWIQMKKIKYLQDRNPGVPGIIYKLEPENEKQRKLQNVRKLWAAVFDISDIRDIYSGNPLEKKKYEIDHFVPWSFITNDEMWNLMPVNSSLNSSKRDRLPDWNTYFSGFAQNQFVLNQMIYKYERLAHMFRECQRDNLNSLWSMEELYIKGIDENQFIRVLESRLKPIYDSARTQGYGVWLAG
ncbi:MAG: HNH endonuclease [Lachnobacterium sp.]|nr:HNH endonuclease [Lachnobacterium sp.]